VNTHYRDALAKKAMTVEARDNAAFVGIDISRISAVAEHPFAHIAAAVVDGGCAVLAVKGIEKIADNLEDDQADEGKVAINNYGNGTIVYTGDGSGTASSDQSVTEGAE